MDMTETYKSFARVWKMFTEVRTGNYTDAAWKICVGEAEDIGKTGGLFLQDLVCAVIAEAEKEAKLQDIPARNRAYDAACQAYNKAWILLKKLMRCDQDGFSANGIRFLTEYEQCFGGLLKPHDFALRLGQVVYKTACMEKHGDGAFVMVAMEFYQKYASGIAESDLGTAWAEAEQIINSRPEYTLHMMELLSGLKRKTINKAA